MKEKSSTSKKKSVTVSSDKPPANLLSEIRSIWEASRSQVARSVDTAHVKASWLIGRQIVEALQRGKKRAGYGEQLFSYLSENLSKEYGAGFSISSLKYMRIFYQAYPNLLKAIRHPVDDESRLSPIHHPLGDELTLANWTPGQLHTSLSSRHYRTLSKVDRIDARNFYEIETIHNNWSGRQLERQINSLLFERLLKSRDKKGLLALANKGQEISKPIDIIKDPFILEFLDLPESHRLVETKVEKALISKLKDFLLELGSGFAYVGRQKRLTLEGDHFYPDLVFYHIKLKCYVIIDLKTKKLSHGDLGQMQMYVHYYDREIKAKNENPTIGLILCTSKNDAVVKYVLDEKQRQIFTSKYQYALPTVDTLQRELRREMESISLHTAAKTIHKKKRTPK